MNSTTRVEGWDGTPASDGEAASLVESAMLLRWRAPELALLLADRAVNAAGGDRSAVLSADHLAAFALNRLGRHGAAVHRLLPPLADADTPAALRHELNVELAHCALALGEPGAALNAVHPVLSAGDDVSAMLRGTALVITAEASGAMGRADVVPTALDEADELYQEDPYLDHDTTLLLRAAAATVHAAHHRRTGGAAKALTQVKSSRELLRGLADPEHDSGQVSGRLMLELVLALLDLGEGEVALQEARPVLRRPVRAAAACSLGWLRLALATRVHLAQARHEPALALLADAVELTQRHGADAVLAECLEGLSHVHEVRGEYADALHCVRSARAAEGRHRRSTEAARAALLQHSGWMQRGLAGLVDQVAPLLAGHHADRADPDPLTGLLDQEAFRSSVDRALADSGALSQVLIAVRPQTEHFPDVLCVLCDQLRLAVPDGAVLGCIGENLVAVLLRSMGRRQAQTWADNFRAMVPAKLRGEITIGVAQHRAGTAADQLHADAERAVHRATDRAMDQADAPAGWARSAPPAPAPFAPDAEPITTEMAALKGLPPGPAVPVRTHERATHEPVAYQPVAYESAAYESAAYEPITGEPPGYAPITGEPSTYQPITPEPPRYEPVTPEPPGYEPITGGPAMYGPPTTEPAAYEPMTPDLAASQPAVPGLDVPEPLARQSAADLLFGSERIAAESAGFEPPTREATHASDPAEPESAGSAAPSEASPRAAPEPVTMLMPLSLMPPALGSGRSRTAGSSDWSSAVRGTAESASTRDGGRGARRNGTNPATRDQRVVPALPWLASPPEGSGRHGHSEESKGSSPSEDVPAADPISASASEIVSPSERFTNGHTRTHGVDTGQYRVHEPPGLHAGLAATGHASDAATPPETRRRRGDGAPVLVSDLLPKAVLSPGRSGRRRAEDRTEGPGENQARTDEGRTDDDRTEGWPSTNGSDSRWPSTNRSDNDRSGFNGIADDRPEISGSADGRAAFNGSGDGPAGFSGSGNSPASFNGSGDGPAGFSVSGNDRPGFSGPGNGPAGGADRTATPDLPHSAANGSSADAPASKSVGGQAAPPAPEGSFAARTPLSPPGATGIATEAAPKENEQQSAADSPAEPPVDALAPSVEATSNGSRASGKTHKVGMGDLLAEALVAFQESHAPAARSNGTRSAGDHAEGSAQPVATDYTPWSAGLHLAADPVDRYPGKATDAITDPVLRLPELTAEPMWPPPAEDR